MSHKTAFFLRYIVLSASLGEQGFKHLLMLLFLQYVAIILLNSTNISTQIVSNFQINQQLKITAYKAIDYVISNKDHFINYSNYINSDGDFLLI